MDPHAAVDLIRKPSRPSPAGSARSPASVLQDPSRIDVPCGNIAEAGHAHDRTLIDADP